MLPSDLLLEHLTTVVVVWGWAVAAGLPLAALLRFPLSFGAAALLGIAYWAVALFLLPPPYGLDLGMAAAAAGMCVVLLRRRIAFRHLAAQVRGWGGWVLVLGCGAYATLLIFQFVPPGMDASMHTTNARLIAATGGLPRNYAPFAAELPLQAVNLGLPTVAAAAIRLGCSPAAAMLAAEHLAFSAFLLGAYLLLRLWTSHAAAALLALFAAWTTRGAQETVMWGGFPTVAGLALGLLAARLLIDLGRRPSYRAAVPLGLTIAALPLVHGVSAAVWVYVAAPMAVFIALTRARRPWKVIRTLAATAAVTALVLLAYLVRAPQVSPEGRAWVAAFMKDNAPQGQGWELLLSVPAYVKTRAGSMGIWPGLVAVGVLLYRRRWRAALALGIAAALLCGVVANSRGWVLPLSMLLYPERAVYLATPLAAVALALAWRSLGPTMRRTGWLRLTLVAALLAAAALRHVQGFQRNAVRPTISRAEWNALLWSAKNLDPNTDCVSCEYNTAGSYLPAVAGIATSGWHMHFMVQPETASALPSRPSTYRLETEAGPATAESQGEAVVFHDQQVTILRLPGDAPSNR